MTDPKKIRIEDYNYPLPDERIAKYPLQDRSASKLLTLRGGQISHTVFRSLPSLLPKGALVVMNNTRVIQARLHFCKSTGALIEVFCLEPFAPRDYAEMFQATGHCEWLCMVGNLKRWKEGLLTRELPDGTVLAAERIETLGTAHHVRFSWNSHATWAEVLDAVGELPIPPYLNRKTEESDKTTYQTVYSRIKGSVAAPTAGLHFTPEVLAELDARGIERDEVTLHVGAGTFKPVKSEEMEGHEMHSEHIAVSRHNIERLLAHGGRCIAVGTTSVRTLESLYYIGLRLGTNPDATEDELGIEQWEPYIGTTNQEDTSTVTALQNILDWMTRTGQDVLQTSTQIIIAPGYKFHIVSGMVTNFHQPCSTLLLLVSAFVGGKMWKDIYRYALDNGFRFLSYGDSSLLLPQGDNADELFPIVDEEGNVTGQATRGECHDGVHRHLHPVVHLHVFDTEGRLFLQRRPEWKDIQPGRWDTAVGGHIDLGETVEHALAREAREELGIDVNSGTSPLGRYVWESDRERELVNSFRATVSTTPTPSAETDGGRFWTVEELREAIGGGIFTPNLEHELRLFVLASLNAV